MKRIILTVVAFSFMGSSAAGDRAQITSKELIRRYESSVAVFRRATFTAQVKIYSSRSDSPKDRPRTESSLRVWRDGDRWKLIEISNGYTLKQGKVRHRRSADESVYPGKGQMSVGLNPDGTARGVAATLRELSADERADIQMTDFGPVVAGRFFWTRHPLPDVLKRSDVSARQVQFEGKTYWLLHSKGEWGEHSLWLDPDRGYVPRRIVETREGADKVYLGPGEVFTIATVPARNNGPWSRLREQLDATRIERIDGKHVITGWTFIQETTYSTNRSGWDRTVVSLSDINLRPEFTEDSFKLTTPIPDGTDVSVDDQPGIDYEWRGGQIVKKVDQTSVDNLEGNWFRRGFPFGWGIMALAMLVLVVFGVVLWYRRRAKG